MTRWVAGPSISLRANGRGDPGREIPACDGNDALGGGPFDFPQGERLRAPGDPLTGARIPALRRAHDRPFDGLRIGPFDFPQDERKVGTQGARFPPARE